MIAYNFNLNLPKGEAFMGKSLTKMNVPHLGLNFGENYRRNASTEV